MLQRPPSFAARAALSLVLLAGFYVLALAAAAVLLALPLLDDWAGQPLAPSAQGFCLIGAALILRGVLPRRDRFTPPGPRLEEAQQPRLFGLLRAVADAAGQAMPTEVYLDPTLNAWVAERGGFLGVGGRRVMGVGLPLLEVLTVDQLRAVLAHELGHYHGGDTALGPLVYRTRAAMERTLRGMRRHSSLLALPFELYGRLFLWVTRAVSRRQEHSADALAARIVGPLPLIEALQSLEANAGAVESFWSTQVGPVLAAGYRPPLAEGLRAYLALPEVAERARRELDGGMAVARAAAWDTHPPLGERVRALRALVSAGPRGVPAGRPALALLDGLEALEAQLAATLRAPAARPIGWEDVPERVHLPAWRTVALRESPRMRGTRVAEWGAFAGQPHALPVRLRYVPHPSVSLEADVERGRHALGAALLLALHARGWRMEALPGRSVAMTGGELRVYPFAAVGALLEGSLAEDGWRRIWEGAGIADLDLADEAVSARVPDGEGLPAR
jgi:heat shock protein HtpX